MFLIDEWMWIKSFLILKWKLNYLSIQLLFLYKYPHWSKTKTGLLHFSIPLFFALKIKQWQSIENSGELLSDHVFWSRSSVVL